MSKRKKTQADCTDEEGARRCGFFNTVTQEVSEYSNLTLDDRERLNMALARQGSAWRWVPVAKEGDLMANQGAHDERHGDE
jgi:hypothetical protein